VFSLENLVDGGEEDDGSGTDPGGRHRVRRSVWMRRAGGDEDASETRSQRVFRPDLATFVAFWVSVVLCEMRLVLPVVQELSC
jgi:hypothetical protein